MSSVAQTQQKQNVLGMKVEGNWDNLPLSNVVAALSDTLKVKIVLSNHLKERRITASVQNLTLRETLDCITELNDWTWYQTDEGEILITTRQTKVNNLEQMKKAILHTLPLDARTYLGLDISDEELKKREKVIKTDPNLNRPAFLPKRTFSFNVELSAKLNSVGNKNSQQLLKALAPELQNSQKVFGSQLETKPREMLLRTLYSRLLSSYFLMLPEEAGSLASNLKLQVGQIEDYSLSLINNNSSLQVGRRQSAVGDNGATRVRFSGTSIEYK